MFQKFIAFLCCLITVNGLEYYTEKPEWIKTCKIYEPEFLKCSTESIQILMDNLMKDEIPELKENFGSLDPMKIDEIIFKGDNNQAVTIAANLTDMIAKGFSKIKIVENRVSKKDFSWETKIFIPRLRLDGKYKMAGRILLIPLNGAGSIFLDIENVNILMRAKNRLYEKGGLIFFDVQQISVRLNITHVESYLDNIFNGNSKEVERSTNQFFNDNWSDFFEALRPLISETVERILLKVLQATFKLLPGNFFIEDIPKSTELYNKKS